MGSTDKSFKLNNSSPEDQDKEDDQMIKTPGNAEQGAREKSSSGGADSSSNTGAGYVGGPGSRPRHDSNSSSDSARSPSSDRMKRRRTTSLSSSPLSSFFFPPPTSSSSMNPSHPFPSSSLSPSPSFSTMLSSSPGTSSTFAASSSSSSSSPSLMSLDEVMSAVNGVTNMALAHEIALDSNFKLEKFEPPQASIEKQVRDVMHQAFWDNLRDQLKQDPPVYTQSFVLLQEVRDQLLEITLPHQRKLRNEINEKLDVDLIKQQAEHGVLDFAGYSGYVVGLMGKLCAPVRDEAIQRLQQETDVVTVFRGVAETLDLMKLDMANYTIQMIRPTIVKQIVEYERGKFKEFLKTQQDGLELTRAWILKHVDRTLRDQSTTAFTPSAEMGASQALPTGGCASSSSGCLAPPTSLLADPLALRAFCHSALNSAYMELLQWPQETLLPETACVDSERILELRDRLHQLCLLASGLLVALSALARHRPGLAAGQPAEEFKAALKRDLCPILDPAYTQSETLSALPNLVEQVVASMQGFLKERACPPVDAAAITLLRGQLKELSDPGHRVTTLVTSRCVTFLAQILGNANPKNISVPAPFVILQEEVARICGAFLRLTQHNRAVFGEYYFDMTENRLKQLVPPQPQDGVRHESQPQNSARPQLTVEPSAKVQQKDDEDKEALDERSGGRELEQTVKDGGEEKSSTESDGDCSSKVNNSKHDSGIISIENSNDSESAGDKEKTSVRWDSLNLD